MSEIVHDSADVLALFRELLEDEGYRVSTQPCLDKDLDEIHTLEPDLIILDYMWGTDDAGWSLLQMLKMNPSTSANPVVLCTGAVRRVTDPEAHLTEMSVTVVFKPFKLEMLLVAVADGLEPKQGS